MKKSSKIAEILDGCIINGYGFNKSSIIGKNGELEEHITIYEEKSDSELDEQLTFDPEDLVALCKEVLRKTKMIEPKSNKN